MVKVAPSILAADFSCLEEEIKRVIKAGGDCIHIDVMDGRFVTNVTPGVEMLEVVRKATNIFIDVHLMVEKPQEFMKYFLRANRITFHIEAVTPNIAQEMIKTLKEHNIEIGISIKPMTPIEEIFPYLDQIDMVLIMTVEPGQGGQKLIPETIQKIKQVRQKNQIIDIEVDGGINEETAQVVKEAGANILVAGTAIFQSKNPQKVIELLKKK